MTEKVKVFIADTFDPWFNLATEDWIFNDMDPETKVLFLWRNQNTVVIGRFQNPWTECNVEMMEKDGIKLARRQSGGGAVFHDLGNTNFTFMSSKEGHKKENNNAIIINALKRFNIEAEASGRNDIVVQFDDGPRKFSGSAFKEKRDRAFHHGTLLIDADLTRLGNYLNPNKKKLEAKGIKSVRARVLNLKEINPEITHESLTKVIIEEFLKFYKAQTEVIYLDHEFLKTQPALNDYYEKLKAWEWRFGETPKFTHFFEERFTWGGVEIHLESHKGLIKEVKIYTDCLFPDLISEIQEVLKEVPYEPSEVKVALNKIDHWQFEKEISELTSFVLDQIR